MSRQCTRCKEWKEKEAFYKTEKGRGGMYSWCKECQKDYMHGYYLNHRREKSQYQKRNGRKFHLQMKYDITEERFDSILISQEGVCACCYGPPDKRGWVVDHVHDPSKKVRGILCHPCNVMLGFAKESPIILSKGVDYLERWGIPRGLSPIVEQNSILGNIEHLFQEVTL